MLKENNRVRPKLLIVMILILIAVIIMGGCRFDTAAKWYPYNSYENPYSRYDYDYDYDSGSYDDYEYNYTSAYDY